MSRKFMLVTPNSNVKSFENEEGRFERHLHLVEAAARKPLREFGTTFGRDSSDSETVQWAPEVEEAFRKILAEAPFLSRNPSHLDPDHLVHVLENIRSHLNGVFEAHFTIGDVVSKWNELSEGRTTSPRSKESQTDISKPQDMEADTVTGEAAHALVRDSRDLLNAHVRARENTQNLASQNGRWETESEYSDDDNPRQTFALGQQSNGEHLSPEAFVRFNKPAKELPNRASKQVSIDKDDCGSMRLHYSGCLNGTHLPFCIDLAQALDALDWMEAVFVKKRIYELIHEIKRE